MYLTIRCKSNTIPDGITQTFYRESELHEVSLRSARDPVSKKICNSRKSTKADQDRYHQTFHRPWNILKVFEN